MKGTRQHPPIDIDVIAPEAVPGIRVMPVVHGRVEMAAVVRMVLNELRPAGVAVELPTTLAEPVERAVARLPKVSLVIADEPTGALDRASAENLGQLLIDLNQEEKVTLIAVTHSAELAGRMGRTLELKDGQLI